MVFGVGDLNVVEMKIGKDERKGFGVRTGSAKLLDYMPV